LGFSQRQLGGEIVEFDAVHSLRISPMVRRNLLPPSSGSKCKPSSSVHCLFFVPEDRGSVFLRNVGELLPDYTSSNPRRCNFQHEFVDDKVKGKVVHLFALVPRIEDVRRAGGMTPRILNLGTRWREWCLISIK
jgi:hypothetical protein